MAEDNIEGLEVVDELPDHFSQEVVKTQLEGKELDEGISEADQALMRMMGKDPNPSLPEAKSTDIDKGIPGNVGPQGDPVGIDGLEDLELPEYTNIPDLLNTYFEAGLNKEAIGKLNPKEQARVVVGLFDKVITESNKALDEYEEIDKLLKEDKEVRDFLEFRKKGGTIAELVKQYGTRTEIGDEELVRQDLKAKLKGWSDQEIEEQIELYKDSNKLKRVADALRAYQEENSRLDIEKINNQKKEAERINREKEQQLYLKEVEGYKNYLGAKKDIEGIPLTEEMKNNILALAVGKDKKTNVTHLETALQSDEGVLLAALGILYLPTLIKAGQSIVTNKGNKKFYELLADTPNQLQSNKKGGQVVANDIEIANSW